MTNLVVAKKFQAGTRRAGARLVALLALLALVAAACQTATISLTEIDIVDIHDPVGDDEPYLAVVTWRVKPGTSGSTVVQTLPLTELGGFPQGSTVTVPAAAGEASFSNINPLTVASLSSGGVAEVIGTVTVAMDADNPQGNSAISPDAAAELANLASAIEAKVAATFEPLVPSTTSIGQSNQLNAALGDFLYSGTTITDHVEATLGLLADTSNANQDDVIGTSVTARVVVDSQLSAAFSGFGNSAVAPDSGGPLLAGTESFVTTVTTTNQGLASYDLTFEVTL